MLYTISKSINDMQSLKIFVALVVIYPIITSFGGPQSTKVQFANTDWPTGKETAKTQGKLFFVEFDASYCAVCTNMDKSTYMDQELADFMAENVIANRMDVQSFDGVMWSQQYEVEALPTMLLFNSEGKLLKRLEGYQSAKSLLSTFESYNTPANRVAAKPSKNAGGLTPVTTKTPQAPVVLGSVVDPNKKPAEPDAPGTVVMPKQGEGFKPIVTTKPTVDEKPVTADRPVVVANKPAVAGKGLYEFQVKRGPNVGYGVQIGVFADYANVLSEVEKIQAKSNERVFVNIAFVNGKNVYKLMLGAFGKSAEAEAYRNSLRSKGYMGIVKDYAAGDF